MHTIVGNLGSGLHLLREDAGGPGCGAGLGADADNTRG